MLVSAVFLLTAATGEQASEQSFHYNPQEHSFIPETGDLGNGFHFRYSRGILSMTEPYYVPDELALYHFDEHIYTVYDYSIVRVEKRKHFPASGYLSIFVVTYAGGSGGYGSLLIVTFEDYNLINLQEIALDNYSLLAFHDVNGDGVQEILLRDSFGTLLNLCRACFICVQRLALWQENRWVVDQIGQFAEFYERKAQTAEESLTLDGGVSELAYFAYYKLMAGTPRSEVKASVERLITEFNITMNPDVHGGPKKDIDAIWLVDYLHEKAISFKKSHK